jgi:hypothetical protein
MDLDVVVGDDAEGGDIVLSVAFNILDPSDLQNKVLVKKLQRWPPKLFTVIVDDVVLVGT